MKITAVDLLRLGVIHRIVYEPPGGAHRDPATTIARLAVAIGAELDALSGLSRSELRSDRFAFFSKIGAV